MPINSETWIKLGRFYSFALQGAVSYVTKENDECIASWLKLIPIGIIQSYSLKHFTTNSLSVHVKLFFPVHGISRNTEEIACGIPVG